MGTLTREGKQPYGEAERAFYIPTDTIYLDEPAPWLGEFNKVVGDGSAPQRFQEIHVVRADGVYAWFYNLGPASQFTANEFQVNGGHLGDHAQDMETVESIRDCADWLRDEDGLRREVEQILVTQEHWVAAKEETAKARRHESVSGRYVSIER